MRRVEPRAGRDEDRFVLKVGRQKMSLIFGVSGSWRIISRRWGPPTRTPPEGNPDTGGTPVPEKLRHWGCPGVGHPQTPGAASSGTPFSGGHNRHREHRDGVTQTRTQAPEPRRRGAIGDRGAGSRDRVVRRRRDCSALCVTVVAVLAVTSRSEGWLTLMHMWPRPGVRGPVLARSSVSFVAAAQVPGGDAR